MDIATGLAAAKSGVDVVRTIATLLKQSDVEIDRADIASRLHLVSDQLLDARTALIEAQEEQQQLRTQLAELSRALDFGAEFKFRSGVYWREGFPYCPSCWEADRKPIRLGGGITDPQSYSHQLWTCPFHKVSYRLHPVAV